MATSVGFWVVFNCSCCPCNKWCFFFAEMDQENQTEPTNSDNSTAGITLILKTALIVLQMFGYEYRFLLILLSLYVFIII